MWFCRKDKLLTAKEANKLTLISKEKIIQKRRERLLDVIKSLCKSGYLTYNFNYGNYPSCCNREDIPYLQSLGYKIEEKKMSYNVNMGHIILNDGTYAKPELVDCNVIVVSW